MRTALFGFVSPLPPVRSGIADYAADILPALRNELDLETYEPSGAQRAFSAGHRAVLLHVGNDPMHLPSVEALRRNARRVPSLLVLHDFSLHHLFASAYLDEGRVDDYARELERSHGARGRSLGERARAGERVPVWDLAPWEWPLSTAVAGDASAVIVHSQVVRGALLRERPGVPVFEIPLAVPPAPDHARDDARAALGLPLDRVVAATLGIVTPAKRIGKLLEGLALLSPRKRPLLVVGGAVGSGDPLLDAVRSLGLSEDVRFTGYLSDDDFWRLARASDIAVNLRFPTVGETSAAVCRLAGSGLPVVVSDVGWFRELPDAFASKIPVGEGEAESIAAALGTLAADEALRRRRADAARAWGETVSPSHVAAAHARLLHAVSEGRAASLSLLGRVAREMAAVGLGRNGRSDSRERLPDGLVLEALGTRGAGVLPAPFFPVVGNPEP